MPRSLSAASLLAVALLSAGCATIRPEAALTLDKAREAGLPVNVVQPVDPLAAALLNLAPGIGNLYLGAKSDKTYNYALFPLNLITWPFSILWAVPQAGTDAGVVNREANADYYTYDPEGRARLAAATGATTAGVVSP